MFRTTQCSSSGESIVSIHHLVCITLCRWLPSMPVSPDRHTRQSPTQSDTYQMMYWYNWFSWWWALGCSKDVEKWNKCIKKCVELVINKNCTEMHGQQNIKYHEPLLQTSRIQYEPSCNITLNNTLTLSRNTVRASEGRRCPFLYYVRCVKFRVKIKEEPVHPVPYTLPGFCLLLITSNDAFQIPYFIECKWIIVYKKRCTEME
jgi:hypothetical protein